MSFASPEYHFSIFFAAANLKSVQIGDRMPQGFRVMKNGCVQCRGRDYGGEYLLHDLRSVPYDSFRQCERNNLIPLEELSNRCHPVDHRICGWKRVCGEKRREKGICCSTWNECNGQRLNGFEIARDGCINGIDNFMQRPVAAAENQRSFARNLSSLSKDRRPLRRRVLPFP